MPSAAQGASPLEEKIESALRKITDLLQEEVQRRTPVRTGHLQASIFGEVFYPTGVVATDVAYGVPVEFGWTSSRGREVPGRHMFENALLESLDKIEEILAEEITEGVRLTIQGP